MSVNQEDRDASFTLFCFGIAALVCTSVGLGQLFGTGVGWLFAGGGLFVLAIAFVIAHRRLRR